MPIRTHRLSLVAAAALALAAAPMAASAQSGSGGTMTSPDAPRAEPVDLGGLRGVQPLMGAEVRNADGDDIGDLEDLLLTGDGTVFAAVVEVGAFLGLGGKRVAVPFAAVERSADDAVTIDASAELLNGRMACDAENVSVKMFAPLGFGQAEPDEVSQSRDAYIEEWRGKMADWSDQLEEGASEMSATAEAELQSAWSQVRAAWSDVQSSSRANWERTTDSFESAYASFQETWEEHEASGSMSGGSSGSMSDGKAKKSE